MTREQAIEVSELILGALSLALLGIALFCAVIGERYEGMAALAGCIVFGIGALACKELMGGVR